MRAFSFTIVAAAALTAASLASAPALAQADQAAPVHQMDQIDQVDQADPVSAWPHRLGFAQGADRDSSGSSAPSLAVQFSANSDIGLHGGLDRGEPEILGDKPTIPEARFGLRIAF
jgi:hypothetical protein